MSGRRWRIGGSLFSLLVLLVGSTAAGVSVTPQRSTDTVLSYSGIRRLVVESVNGTLTVRAGGPTVTVRRHVEWASPRPSLEERLDGETLTLRASCTASSDVGSSVRISVGCVVTYEIEVPPAIEIVANADERIDVDGVTGALDLTSNGPILVTGAGGAVSARTTNGDVTIRPRR